MNEQTQRPDIFDAMRRDLTRQRLANLIGLHLTERTFPPVEFDSIQLRIRVINRKPASAKRQAMLRNP